jgi:hypothetical protein
MSRMQVLALAGAMSVLGSQVFAGPCGQRIAEMEKSAIAPQEGAGPATTGALQGGATASGDQPGPAAANAPAPDNRLPANRPASSESAAAQVQASTSGQGTAAGQETQNRMAANRPQSPEAQAAETQAHASAPAGTSPQRASNVLEVLREAKLLDQQGREAECMQALSKAGPVPPIK